MTLLKAERCTLFIVDRENGSLWFNTDQARAATPKRAVPSPTPAATRLTRAVPRPGQIDGGEKIEMPMGKVTASGASGTSHPVLNRPAL